MNLLDPSGCWIWTASVNGKGKYGCFGVAGKIHRAHRISYFLAHGIDPGHLTVDHSCRNHRCVNPSHLQAVTNRTNILRHHYRKDTCKRGHKFDILLNGDKHRGCSKCQKILRDKYARQKKGLTA